MRRWSFTFNGPARAFDPDTVSVAGDEAAGRAVAAHVAAIIADFDQDTTLVAVVAYAFDGDEQPVNINLSARKCANLEVV